MSLCGMIEHFFLFLNNIPLLGCIAVIYSFIEGHLGYFQFWVIIDKAVINIWRQIFLCWSVFYSIGQIGARLLNSMLTLCLALWKSAEPSSTVAAPSFIPTDNKQEFLLLHFIVIICYQLLKNFSQPNRHLIVVLIVTP